MIKIRILSPGKVKEEWLKEAISEYLKRMSNYASVDLLFTKDEKEFYKLLEQEKNLILLDPLGKEMTSENFSSYFFKRVEIGGSNISFAIGGPEGFSREFIKDKPLLSLSKMTFTHQMVRLILMEQLFRAFEIEKGSEYHK